MRLNQYEWDPENDIIAEGAFAEVFKARDTNSTNRFVALKIYKQAVSRGTSVSSGQKKYSLEKEFQNVDGLSHSNIISYFGLDYIKHADAMGRSSSYAVLIMEFAEGGTLKDFMQSKPDKELVDKIIIDILHGVRYLHNEGIIHRDLKPGNILITKNRKGIPIAKITDFGISRDTFSQNLDEQSMTEGVGTPHYMAPEQLYKKKFGLNGEISNRTDIWAVGVIIYRILSGQLPFGSNGKDNDYIRESIINDEPDYSKVSGSYVNLLKACFQKHAAERPRNVNELLGLFNTVDEEKTIVDVDDLPTELVVENDEFLKTNFKDTDSEEPAVVDTKNEKRHKLEKADKGSRFLAWVIDFVISLILVGLIFTLLWGLFFGFKKDLGYHQSLFLTIISFMFGLVIYYIIPELKYGKTLGSHILRIQLFSLKNGKVNNKQVIVRNIIKALTILGGFTLMIETILPIGYFLLTCLISAVSLIFNQTIHNRFAKLVLVKRPKNIKDLDSEGYYVNTKFENKTNRKSRDEEGKELVSGQTHTL